jgi:hypothetical protein
MNYDGSNKNWILAIVSTVVGDRGGGGIFSSFLKKSSRLNFIKIFVKNY